MGNILPLPVPFRTGCPVVIKELVVGETRNCCCGSRENCCAVSHHVRCGSPWHLYSPARAHAGGVCLACRLCLTLASCMVAWQDLSARREGLGGALPPQGVCVPEGTQKCRAPRGGDAVSAHRCHVAWSLTC